MPINPYLQHVSTLDNNLHRRVLVNVLLNKVFYHSMAMLLLLVIEIFRIVVVVVVVVDVVVVVVVIVF